MLKADEKAAAADTGTANSHTNATQFRILLAGSLFRATTKQMAASQTNGTFVDQTHELSRGILAQSISLIKHTSCGAEFGRSDCHVDGYARGDVHAFQLKSTRALSGSMICGLRALEDCCLWSESTREYLLIVWLVFPRKKGVLDPRRKSATRSTHTREAERQLG